MTTQTERENARYRKDVEKAVEVSEIMEGDDQTWLLSHKQALRAQLFYDVFTCKWGVLFIFLTHGLRARGLFQAKLVILTWEKSFKALGWFLWMRRNLEKMAKTDLFNKWSPFLGVFGKVTPVRLAYWPLRRSDVRKVGCWNHQAVEKLKPRSRRDTRLRFGAAWVFLNGFIPRLKWRSEEFRRRILEDCTYIW